MNTVAILLSAFVLSFVSLLAFIWSQRTGLFDRSSKQSIEHNLCVEYTTPRTPLILLGTH